jgi:precorrin-6x reductase
MRVLVCGSRGFNDYEFAKRFLSGYGITSIIHGGARGADSCGAKYAQDVGIPCIAFNADWNSYGRRAGIIRNERMLKEGAPDLVVAFWDGNSKGTKHMIDIAEKAGVPVRIIDIE